MHYSTTRSSPASSTYSLGDAISILSRGLVSETVIRPPLQPSTYLQTTVYSGFVSLNVVLPLFGNFIWARDFSYIDGLLPGS